MLNAVELNQVLFRPRHPAGPDARDLAAAVQRDGTCWIGTSVWDGRPALRLSVSNWSTTPQDVTRSTDRVLALVEAARRG
ncbi:hypothetical protein ACQPX6_19290 [Actinomycetospora sp. CA-101289]|uniref:hypothetical protein n=1 Tax=Actinomycetospora sp. CA-101289 TaxID=3239893 RepID=UPI003D9749BD